MPIVKSTADEMSNCRYNTRCKIRTQLSTKPFQKQHNDSIAPKKRPPSEEKENCQGT